MKKLFAILMALALLAGAALAEGADLIGTPAPNFTVTTCEGEQVVLSDLLAEKDLVVLNIFTSWCPPCRMEFPGMQSIYEALSDRMEIVAVSDEPTDTDQVIADYKAELGLTFPMGRIENTGISEYMTLEGYPTTLFIDRNGNVCHFQLGAFPFDSPMRALADYFLSEDYDGTPATLYNVYVCDQDENPVPGVYVNFCTDTTCEPRVSDENGAICFVADPASYHLKILKVPEGYSFDADFEAECDDAPDAWTLVEVTRD